MKQSPANPSKKRGRYGFQRASSLLQPRIRAAGESRGFAVSRLLTHWVEIVGETTANMARPVDVKYGCQGLGATLTLLTTGAQAPILEMQKETIRARVNACYGYSAIARIRITQTAATGFAEGQAQFRATPKPGKPRPDPQTRQQAQKIAAPVADQGLRDALAALGANVISRSSDDKRN
ncbi:MAG: RNA-binding protein [Rhodobacterales bacterium]|nr:MAG: RNA-binding protein [Rhodobacterales bacterium]